MAGKVDKTTAVLPLSVSVPVEEEEKRRKQARAAPSSLLPAVRDVILWTLFNAGIVTGSFAFSISYTLIMSNISQPPSWLLPGPVEMTDAEVDVAGALVTLWCVCVVSQAAAGVLALMLPRHRLLLAYAALVATAAGHSMWAGLHRMFVAANPEGLYLRTVGTAGIFISGVGDLICFLGLFLRGGEEY